MKALFIGGTGTISSACVELAVARGNYQTYGANTGYTYDQYQPVYRYGYSLAADPSYRGWEWDRIEPEARRWEERNPNSWERFKASVRYAWERAKDAVD